MTKSTLGQPIHGFRGVYWHKKGHGWRVSGEDLKIIAQENMEEWVVRRRSGDKAVRAAETHIILLRETGEERISLLE